MKKRISLKQIAVKRLVSFAFFCAMAVADIGGNRDNGSFEEIWLMLRKKEGSVVNLRV